MPYITKKPSTTSAVLSWDAFPPAPPEAEGWQPDPDSIAKSGALKDPRFNRDPYAIKKAAALKRDAHVFGLPSGLTDSSSSSSFSSVGGTITTPLGVRGWPAPEYRASGPLYSNSPVTVTRLPTQITKAPPLPTSRPCTPITTQAASTDSVSPFKIPAWAGPLEKLLAEEAASSAVQPTHPPRASIPPHLRKKSNPTAQPNTVTIKTDAKETKSNNADLALKLATKDLGVDNTKESLRLQERMLHDHKTVTQQFTHTHNSDDFQDYHKRYLNVKLVSMLEDELDLGKRATKKELMAMPDDDLQNYLTKATSAHKNWWVAEHKFAK